MFYLAALRRAKGVEFFRWDDYQSYDVALFMTYSADLEDLVKARQQNPKLRIGLIDARGSQTFKYLNHVDFLVLDSLEMSDFFARFNKPTFTYVEYADAPVVRRTHQAKDRITIAYHGNRAHLMGMFPEVSTTLDELGRNYSVELLAIYDVGRRPCCVGLPKHIPVRHVQWYPGVYAKELAEADVGIAPALVPIRHAGLVRRLSATWRVLAPHRDDYLIRFKMPSNPGRVVSFAFAGVPVVASFLPSFLQFIRHGENGFLAHSAGGWYRALESLVESPELRGGFSERLQAECVERVGYDRQNAKFLKFLETLLSGDGDQRPTPSLGTDRAARWSYFGGMMREDARLAERGLVRVAKRIQCAFTSTTK